jgi:hypothetical protein
VDVDENDASRIDRSAKHPFLAEYDRVLVLERDGKELARRPMFPDTGGYGRTNVYDLGNSKTLLLSAFDAYVLDYDRADIQVVDQCAVEVPDDQAVAIDALHMSSVPYTHSITENGPMRKRSSYFA